MGAGHLDPLVFSSVWVAAAAAALCAASAGSLGVAPSAPVLGLAACGTFAIYNLDRLRDLERDRSTAPRRSRFIEAHRALLLGGAVAAAVVSVGLGARLGAPVVVLLVPALIAGLLHRRLKRFTGWKALYIAAAWTIVVVGLPATTGSSPRHLAWVGGIVFVTTLANAIASNLRDREALAAALGERVPLQLARGTALLGLLGALLAPAAVRPLALVPGLTLLALGPFQAEERYGLLIVDGALLVGALLALPFF